MATRLSCSQCPSGSYIRTTEGEGDYKCEHCDHRVMYLDLANHLDEHEVLDYDDDGYVTVEVLGSCIQVGHTYSYHPRTDVCMNFVERV